MKKVAKDSVRSQVMEQLKASMEDAGSQVLVVGSGSFSVPVVSPDGEEGFVTVSVVVREKDRDGVAYDGFADAEAYAGELMDKVRLKAEKLAEKERKAALREAKKAEKAKAEVKE